MNQISTEALVESKALRESVINKTYILDKVKKLRLLPDDIHTTIEMTANYYEVGFEAIKSLIKDNREELELDNLQTLKGNELRSLKDLGVIGKNTASLTIIPKRAILRIGMLLRDSEVAKAVRTMLLDVESTTHYTTQFSDPALLHHKKELLAMQMATEILRLPDSGKLKLLGDYNKKNGLQIPLPAYADEERTESATELLRKNGISVDTKKFNLLLLQKGILEEKDRPSSKGKTKLFKSLTDVGMAYGKNMISPANPRETQPHYYAEKFPELLKQVGL